MARTLITPDLVDIISTWDFGLVDLDAGLFVRENICAVCGAPYVDIHHIFPGSSRRAVSERYGLKIPLCRKHHEECHKYPNEGIDILWKRSAQQYYEKYYGTREEFIKEFGKSWL